MKRLVMLASMLLVTTIFGHAQKSGLTGIPPTAKELGAPLYPGAVFIRTVTGLNPYYETAMYVSIDRMRTVEDWLERKLPEKRKSFYSDDKTYMTVFLLKTWTAFPGNPSKDELSKLEYEPNIQVYEYDREPYEPLAEFYDRKPEDKPKAEAIRTGRTLILYTYKRTEEFRSEKKIIGDWLSTDRDLKTFYQSTLRFNDDGTYVFSFTPQNIETLVNSYSTQEQFKGRSKEEIQRYLESRNPEKGTYVIMKNTITLVSENPLIKPETKSGLAIVGSSVLSLDLIDQPRLTFIRQSPQ